MNIPVVQQRLTQRKHRNLVSIQLNDITIFKKASLTSINGGSTEIQVSLSSLLREDWR